MCLMQTDLPVPDGPRIIEILSFGMPRLSPRRILLRPNALWTSTNSTASSPPAGLVSPVCQRYSSSGGFSLSREISGGLRSSATSASDGSSRVRTPEDLGAQHADEVHEHDVEHHRLRGRRADADRATRRVVAVVAADQHDDRGHHHRLDDAEQEVRWVLEHPEDQEEPARADLAYLLDHRQVGREEPRA